MQKTIFIGAFLLFDAVIFEQHYSDTEAVSISEVELGRELRGVAEWAFCFVLFDR